MANIVELVRLGFHGAAIAMAILSYRLLGKALDSPVTKRDTQVLKTFRFFMIICLVLFVVGAAAEVLDRLIVPVQIKPVVNMRLLPAIWPKKLDRFRTLVSVSLQGKPVKMERGLATVDVGDKDWVLFDMEELVQAIDELEIDSKKLLRQEDSVIAQQLAQLKNQMTCFGNCRVSQGEVCGERMPASWTRSSSLGAEVNPREYCQLRLNYIRSKITALQQRLAESEGANE